MKIAITAHGPGIHYQVSQQFGRCEYFAVYNNESNNFIFKSNILNILEKHGVGIKAVQILTNAGVEVLITGHCGPNAFKMLYDNKIKIYAGAFDTVQTAVKDYEYGRLKEIHTFDIEKHWLV